MSAEAPPTWRRSAELEAASPRRFPETPRWTCLRVLEIVELPCVLDRFIEARPAVRHPSLTSPVAFLGDVELAPLLRCVRGGMTSPELVARLDASGSAPIQGLSIAHWLMARGLLVPQRAGAHGDTTGGWHDPGLG